MRGAAVLGRVTVAANDKSSITCKELQIAIMSECRYRLRSYKAAGPLQVILGPDQRYLAWLTVPVKFNRHHGILDMVTDSYALLV